VCGRGSRWGGGGITFSKPVQSRAWALDPSIGLCNETAHAMSEPRLHKVLIIGSGPAGLTAAIYAARANLKPLCVEGFNAGGLIPGGQLMFTSDVENYPGFPSSVTGQDLMMRFRQQAEHQGAEIITHDVQKVDFSQ